jgi:hypothetical protein
MRLGGANLVKQRGVAVVKSVDDRSQHLHIVPQACDFGRQPLQATADLGQIDHTFGMFVAHRPQL